MGGAECQASRKKAPANRLGQSAEYPSATSTCPPVTSLLSCPPSAMLGCRPVAGELLDVAMHDLICIMYEMRLRVRRTTHTESSGDAWQPKGSLQGSTWHL